MKVLEAICKVSEELAKEGIKKDRSNTQQGYKFRGIDDCLNALAPLMAKHGLVIMPECLERTVQERESRNGGMLFYVTVKVLYKFYSIEDPSFFPAVVYGEAMDSADKATNKAMSAAYKYAVIQTFCIPTEGDNDADATTHELANPAQRFAQQKATIAKAFQEIKQDIKSVVEQDGASMNKGGSVHDLPESVMPRKTSDAAPPFNPEVCPPADGVPDETYQQFLEYVGDDPDRTKVGKKMKAKLNISEMSTVAPAKRKAIILSIQDEARRQGVPFSAWVTE